MNKFNGKLLALNCVIFLLLLPIYMIVNAQGMRMSIVTLGMKLHRLPMPGFSWLNHVKNLRDLDLAHFLAVFALIAVWVLSTAVLEIYFFGTRPDPRLNVSKHVRFLFILAAAVLICDVCMFYRGIGDQGSLFEAGGGVTSVIATIGYSGLLAFAAYLHVMFKHRIF